ncbi:MAG: DinB family protein [Chloroflexota bacterium]
MRLIPKPQPEEHVPYVLMYIDLLPDDGRILQHLSDNLEATKQFIATFPDDFLAKPHAPNEWTIKEILVHIIDDERIYAYRALRFARNDFTELPGFEQDDYIIPSRANERTIEDILAELTAVRLATLSLYQNLPEETLTRAGIASGNIMSVRTIAYHIAGHELHHMNSIRENYGDWRR